MRLPDEILRGGFALTVALALGSCGVIGGAPRADLGKPQPSAIAQSAVSGPAADYPVTIGEPYKIDGFEYVPADTWNYDEVGYASAEPGEGFTASHKTLPLPSYAEVTSLESGRTVLIRVERRGPLTNTRVVGLSPEAQSSLGVTEGSPIRIRRVNPPEEERALLRAGQAAPARLDTPVSLVAVLKRKLPAAGAVSLAAEPTPNDIRVEEQPGADPAPQIAIENVFEAEAKHEEAATSESVASVQQDEPRTPVAGEFVIQAAAFSSKMNAEKAAKAIEGFVDAKGKFFHVRTGPYMSRGQADAALAKVKAAGYSDARVIKAG